jgi:hypothetical protein
MHNTDIDIHHIRLREIDNELEQFERQAVVTGSSLSALLILTLTACLAVI